MTKAKCRNNTLYLIAGSRNIDLAKLSNSGLYANVGMVNADRTVESRLRDPDYRKKMASGKWIILNEINIGCLKDHDIHHFLKSHPDVVHDKTNPNTEEYLFKTDTGDGQEAHKILQAIIIEKCIPSAASDVIDELRFKISTLSAEFDEQKEEINTFRADEMYQKMTGEVASLLIQVGNLKDDVSFKNQTIDNLNQTIKHTKTKLSTTSHDLDLKSAANERLRRENEEYTNCTTWHDCTCHKCLKRRQERNKARIIDLARQKDIALRETASARSDLNSAHSVINNQNESIAQQKKGVTALLVVLAALVLVTLGGWYHHNSVVDSYETEISTKWKPRTGELLRRGKEIKRLEKNLERREEHHIIHDDGWVYRVTVDTSSGTCKEGKCSKVKSVYVINAPNDRYDKTYITNKVGIEAVAKLITQ